MAPDSTNDGMMKNTVTKTAWADVWATAETRTPIASDASTNGSVTANRASQLPCGQTPKQIPAASVAETRSAYDITTYGTSFPSTISSVVVGSARTCSYVPVSRSRTIPSAVA